jgi:acyl-CoA synthetase (NDP forming)
VLDAAVVLGHGPEVSRQHYNMATAVEAAQRHDDRVSRLKRETALRAARLFAERADRRGQEQAARVGQPEETAAP